MGALCEDAITLTSQALTCHDHEAATRVGPIDREIDRMERSIENLCLRLLLQQQPVATDFRQISAALKMITDMERIGDQAEDIAEIVPHLSETHRMDCAHIEHMAQSCIKMVTESIDAYVRQDVKLAQTAIAHDDIVDSDFITVKHDLIRHITQNPEDGEYALDLLMIAKYFERIADHATNIAEWVVFSVTGLHKGDSL